MRPLRYSINVTLDGCCDHEAAVPDADLHRYAAEGIAWADDLLFGRITYQMMESAWRIRDGKRPAWLEDWMAPFCETIDKARKHVVSGTLKSVDWNSELVRGDLGEAVRALKARPGRGILTGGVELPRTLADLDLIDEYDIVVHPRIAGRGPTLFAGMRTVDLKLVNRQELASGAVALRYVPKR
ncbi:MAG: dihydrofolate reductase family protein [Elusimicrobiota bacterium]|nr:MAG: dihydrofolate reductase family protein [Elusimicrobiota bacterium]